MRIARRFRAGRAPEVDPHWYETFFEHDWLELAADHDERLTESEVDFLVEPLQHEPLRQPARPALDGQ